MNKFRSLRELFAKLPEDGKLRHLIRNFNLRMSGGAKNNLPSARDLATELGFDVRLVEMTMSQRGRLIRDTFAGSGYAIEVNQRDDVLTRRWTVLHELMHAFLHRRDDPFAPDQYRAGKNHFYLAEELVEEREVNESVEAIIFGDGALEAAVSLFGDDKPLIARHFGVSEKTLEIALRKR